METVRIGIMVKDNDYRNALLRGLSYESRDFQFISLPASGGSDEKTVTPYDTCQIIITDIEEQGCMYGSSNENDPLVIRLTYHEMYDLERKNGPPEIFRYEDAGVFVNKIIYYYGRAKGIDLYFHGKRKCRKVVFLSLRGGSGTTSAAVTSARFLKYRFDKKTLFISLCPLDGSREYTGGGDRGNMMSLLYHLDAGDDVQLCKFISSHDGVDHVRGEQNNRAAAEMTVSEMKRLLRMIDKMGVYDYVIFDVANHLGSLAGFLMERADVDVVVRQKEDAGDKMPDIGACEQNKAGRVIRVIDFADPGESKTFEQNVADSADISGTEDAEISLAYCPEAFIREEKRTYIDIRGRYGRDVSMLAEKIVECAD